MEPECHSCGESFPSRLYFAAPGLCKSCVGSDAPQPQNVYGAPQDRPPLFERRFWLHVGGVVFLLGTFLMAIVQFAMAIGGTILFGTAGSAQGAGVFIIGLLNVFLTLLVGLPVSAVFFTLRAWDERFDKAEEATS